MDINEMKTEILNRIVVESRRIETAALNQGPLAVNDCVELTADVLGVPHEDR